jgi:hypothetical protein
MLIEAIDKNPHLIKIEADMKLDKDAGKMKKVQFKG